MHASFLFLSKFFTQPLFNASIWPTNSKVAEEVCKSIDRKSKYVILELGPGTGPITEHILHHMDKDAVYYGIEYDADYVSILNKAYGSDNVHFIQGDVKNLERIVHQYIAEKKVDVIISTLPYKPFVDHPQILDWLKSRIDEGTQFRGISYSPFVFKRVYNILAPKILSFFRRNMPPVYVMGSK